MTFYFTGCPAEDVSVPFDTKEFNLTDYLVTAREDFIGRRWLYQEIEHVFKPARQGLSGVLVVGDPGAGKSALSAQLICSRTSSRTIHDHIMGYHLCKHSDKNTQHTGKFVRNLAQMIASRLPEYGYIVTNSSFIQRSLNTDCVTIQDPVGCFEQAILTPLRGLTNEPKENWYIVIDALDECLTQSETSHSIVYLLNNKLPRFPSWLKLVMTSRNESMVSLNSNSITKLIIDPEDTRNIEDIELFLTTKCYRDGPLLHQIKIWFGDNSVENTAKLIAALLSKSQGNFLFVKEMLHHWETSKAGKGNPYALPETLGELYYSYFERLYHRREQFQPIRRVLELLVATFQPLSLKDIFDVLRTKEENLDEDYDFRDRIKDLGHFLRYGENDTVTLYHLSLTEWLTSESNRNGPFYVSKKKGHEVFCDFYFGLIADGDKTSLLKYILTLAQHIAYGGWKEAYVKEFLRFPSQVVNSSDPKSNRTLLHLAATINSTDVVELLLRHFSCIDCLDNRGITPAFLAAEHGLVHNLELMVKRGAKVNRKTKSLTSIYKTEDTESGQFDGNDPVVQSKSKFWASTMLHAAAHGGHLEVVTFLLNNGAFISKVNGVHLTALQIAAENGHLGVVKALYQAGAVADQTALHHAAANNRLEVVKYLLEIGVTDKCMRCDGSFYWLQTKHRLQSPVKVLEKIVFHLKKSCLSKEIGLQDLGDECIEREGKRTDIEVGELFDDKHLIFCQTALHAAVSIGWKAVVKELVSRGTVALACQDYTGRTPLHEAVRKNDSEIVKLLCAKDQTMIHKTCNHWQNVGGHNDKISLTLSDEESVEYHQDICHCGHTPLHLAARYGHWQIGLDLIRSGADEEARDCSGATPLHVAACHNQKEFVYLLTHTNVGANINSRSSNGSTPLHSAAACAAVEVIDELLYHGANISAVDLDGFAPLHYAILHVHPNQLDRKILLNDTNFGSTDTLHLLTIDRSGYLAGFYKDKNLVKNSAHYRWLDTFINLILRGSTVDAVDKNGRTPLHLAAENGLADAVNVLLQRKAKFEIRDKIGKTPLDVAVENSAATSRPLQLILEESFDQLKQHLLDHQMVVYLLLSSGASFTKCNRSGTSLLHRALVNNQPYIAQLLVLKGASVNCKDNLGRTPLTAFLQNGGDWVDVPFTHVNASVKIKCGKPFTLSALHLLSYLPPKLEDDNFFQKITCDDQTCSSKKSPFLKAVESHRLKHSVIDSCLDAEGFTLLHRAAQGANIVAVRNLIKHGANVSLLTPHGHDALTLAVLHSGGNVWQNLAGLEVTLKINDKVSTVAIELLHHAMKTRGFQIVFDSKKPELTLYHLAASRGLAKFIAEIFKEKEKHQLDVNCPNSDGITPMYLAKLFSGYVKFDIFNPWKDVLRVIESHGGQMLFPGKDAEYITIYNRLYGWIPNNLDLKLRPDVRGFVLGLLSTFDYWQNTSRECRQPNLIVEDQFQIGLPVRTILMELLHQLNLTNQRRRFVFAVSLALDHIKLCQSKEEKSFAFYIKSLNVLTKFEALAIRRFFNASHLCYQSSLSILPIKLYYLMMMWHKEVFDSFACIKMVFNAYRTIFMDDRRSKRLIERYEKSNPDWYYSLICSSLRHVFQIHLHYYLWNDAGIELLALYNPNNSSEFIRERMGWTADQLDTNDTVWPFDFLVKFSLGLYRKYDYLNVLNVGLEPRTRIALHSDKMRQMLQQERERRSEFRGNRGRS